MMCTYILVRHLMVRHSMRTSLDELTRSPPALLGQDGADARLQRPGPRAGADQGEGEEPAGGAAARGPRHGARGKRLQAQKTVSTFSAGQ